MTVVYCIVCRVQIESERKDETKIFQQDENWKKYERKPGILFMEAGELEKKYFKSNRNSYWLGLFRVSEYFPVFLFLRD
jgi:hypothetical protein